MLDDSSMSPSDVDASTDETPATIGGRDDARAPAAPPPMFTRARRIVVRVLLALFALVVAAYVGVCAWAAHIYRRALFPAPPERGDLDTPDAALRTLTARDGAPVHVLETPPPSDGRVVVYFHGNGDTIGQSTGLAADLHHRGFGSMLVEYRGYGVSHDSGAPSESGLYLDAEAALDALLAEGIGPDRIALWGTSLGSGVATEMASRDRGRVLVLISPFTSIPAVGEHYVPYLPVRWLVSDRFDSLEKSPSIHIPTLIVHGTADDIVPFTMGEELAHSFPDARFDAVPQAHHNDLFQLDGRRLMDEICDFIARR